MKKFVNEVENILTESLTGFGKAHSDIIDVRLSPDFVFRKHKYSIVFSFYHTLKHLIKEVIKKIFC